MEAEVGPGAGPGPLGGRQDHPGVFPPSPPEGLAVLPRVPPEGAAGWCAGLRCLLGYGPGIAWAAAFLRVPVGILALSVPTPRMGVFSVFV